MNSLKRQEYKKFVEQHILRPYQNMVIDNDKPSNFTDMTYSILPTLFRKNPDWTDKVFDRISNIYDDIEHDYFPHGDVSVAILSEMRKRGMVIV